MNIVSRRKARISRGRLARAREIRQGRSSRSDAPRGIARERVYALLRNCKKRKRRANARDGRRAALRFLNSRERPKPDKTFTRAHDTINPSRSPRVLPAQRAPIRYDLERFSRPFQDISSSRTTSRNTEDTEPDAGGVNL